MYTIHLFITFTSHQCSLNDAKEEFLSWTLEKQAKFVKWIRQDFKYLQDKANAQWFIDHLGESENKEE